MRSINVPTAAMAIVFGLVTAAAIAGEDARFRSARPIWPKGRETEMNLSVGFRAVVDAKPGERATLRIAAATIYRTWVNGQFVGSGPARGPHGYYRVDQWDVSDKVKPGKNVVAVEVAGYNCNSFALLDQPSFVQAEVVLGDQVLASTAGEGEPFAAAVLDYRVEKVQRYSFQRPFTEVYRLTPDYDRWQRDPSAAFAEVETAVQPTKNLIARGVLYPDFTLCSADPVAEGALKRVDKVDNLWKDRSLTAIGPALKGFPENQLATVVSNEAQHWTNETRVEIAISRMNSAFPPQSFSLAERSYKVLDFGVNRTGFLGAKVTCSKKTRLWFVFDEILSGGDVDFKRLGCVNVVSYELEPGSYQLESIEPYTLRYLKIMCLEGQCEIKNGLGDLYLREYAHPRLAEARFASSDPRLNRLYAAGVQTFRQNSLDLFMDCPSRERGGWLCDSFFTSRAAADLAGTRVERNFFENFLLPERFAFLPEGMLPMCYPSDHNDGTFIPNWAMWFVVELDEFAARGGDRSIVDRLKPRVMRLFDYLKQFENTDGLLEKLPSWVFVEWSRANDFVQDVNYPSNMLYAGALDAAGRTYNVAELVAKAQRIRETIRRQSFDGKFFVDNALRRNGKLEVTKNHSEVCQYFAFFFGVATPQTHAELWKTLCEQFGPERQKKGAFPDVYPANSFIGNMVRMELLSQGGRSQQILDESIAYLHYMADQTGTLWENVGSTASCNHGFASHIVHTLYRDVLGVRRVDPIGRKVLIQLADVKLDWCSGAVMTPDGPIDLHWSKRGDQIEYRLIVPKGYEVKINNLTGKKLVK